MSSKSYEQIIMARENGWRMHKSSTGTCAITKPAGTNTAGNTNGGEIVLTDISAYALGSPQTHLAVRNGTAIIWLTKLNDQSNIHFNTYLRSSKGTSLSVETFGAGTRSHVNAAGYITY